MNQQFSLKALIKTASIISFTFLLSNCASQKPKQTVTSQPKEVVEEQTLSAEAKTAASLVEVAKTLPTAQASAALLEASEKYLDENNTVKALWLANHVQPLLSTPDDMYRVLLVKANVLHQLGEIDKAAVWLAKAEDLKQTGQVKHSLAFFTLQERVQRDLDHPVSALFAQMQSFSLNTDVNEEEVLLIWQELNQLSHWQLQQLVAEKPAYIRGWARLSFYARRFGANEAQFHRFIKQWQSQFPTHPAQLIANNLLITPVLALADIKTVAVLLPLSGNQINAGRAAQQGLLAAFEQDPSKELIFIDANSLDWDTLSAQLADQGVEYIIGPLLRVNVENLLARDDVNIPTLLLNLPKTMSLKPHQVALSMRPEDEAVQAAASLVKKDYKQPILLVHQDNVSKRIAKAFTQEWQRLTAQHIETVPFSDSKKMQKNLKESLGVDKSQARIKAIDSRIKQTIKYEARNRRDVDMIYIVGSSVQTKLLKPYIDVNISPFAESIPVYASSRSHSAKHDTSDNQDLTGLTFTEIPWLLPSKQRNNNLFSLTQKLFPERSDSLQGIFAMGYDSLALVDKLGHMQAHRYIRHFGQTGILKLNENQLLTRSLLWGRYQKDQVQEIVMDR